MSDCWATDLLNRLLIPELSEVATHDIPIYLAILEQTQERPVAVLSAEYLEKRSHKTSGQASATLNRLEGSGLIFRHRFATALKVYAVLHRPDPGPVVESQAHLDSLIRQLRAEFKLGKVGPLPILPAGRVYLRDMSDEEGAES